MPSRRHHCRSLQGNRPRISHRDPGEAARCFDQGLSLHRSGQLAPARDFYRLAVDADPLHADGWHLLGVAHAQSDEPRVAADLVQRAIGLMPNTPLYHNSLGNIRRALGDLEGARASLEKALKLKADYPEALNNLGVVEKDSARPGRALELYRKALALKPDYADAHSNLGALLLTQGEVTAARTAIERALALAPEHADAWFNQGVAERLAGRRTASIRAFERAANLRPGYADALAEMGLGLEESGDSAEARRCFEAALQREPGHFKAQYGLAQALLHQRDAGAAALVLAQALELAPKRDPLWTLDGAVKTALGDLAGAEKSYRKALELAPGSAAAYQGLALIQRNSAEDPEREALLAQQAERAAGAPEARAGACFTLGKLLDDRGDYPGAFRYYAQGNRLAAKAYDPARREAYTNDLMETFGSAFFAAGRSPGSDAEAPVFVVGMPRSGTTLTEQVLASHRRVYGAGERNFFARLGPGGGLAHALGADTSYPACVSDLSGRWLRRIARDYLKEIESPAGEAVRVVDKLPANFEHLGLIARTFPRARVIHCRRHPLDTLLSCYFQHFRSGQEFSYELSALGHYYRQYHRLMEHWRAVLPLSILELDYEALVRDLEGESKRLIAFIGLEWDESCLEYYRHARAVYTASLWQVRQPIYATSIGRWKNYAEPLAPLIEALDDLLE